MSAAEPTDLSYFGEIVRGLHPWMARFGLVGGALSIRAAGERILIDALETIAIGASSKAVQLAGGGAGVARIGDLVVRFIYYPGIAGSPTVVGVPAVLYASTSTGAPYTWTPIAVSAAPVPLTTDAGTAFNVTVGSGKVSAG